MKRSSDMWEGYDMISEANRIIEESNRQTEPTVPKRKNRAVFRKAMIISVCAAAAVCAVLAAVILKLKGA